MHAERSTNPDSHDGGERVPFALVLGGGGARGFAHVGVLRGLEAAGLHPSALVGVSMGAIVAATYALNDDWYDVLRNAELGGLPAPPAVDGPENMRLRRARNMFALGRMLLDLTLHRGTAERAVREARVLLRRFTLNRRMEQARVPLAISCTDLRSGRRVVIRKGRAARAAFASAALAGVVPPLEHGRHLLADGAYTDVAPIDVARAFGHPVVIAVDPGQSAEGADPRNGLQVLARAMEICHAQHAQLRFDASDLVLRPVFSRHIETLDFGARRECIAAGVHVVRANLDRIERMLRAPAPRHRATAG